MADSRSESMEGRSKPEVGWRLTSGEFGDDRKGKERSLFL